jgi:predicted RNase H-like nuclease (RuvC/YqgF family)
MRSLYYLLKPKIFICLNLLKPNFLQGLILSNALRAQKDAEDEGCVMALSNLRSEVIELRNEGLEKDKILYSLINRIKEDEATFKAQAEAQKREIEDLRKQLARAKEERTLEETKRESVNNGQITWRKMLKSFVHLRKDAMKNLWNVLRQ